MKPGDAAKMAIELQRLATAARGMTLQDALEGIIQLTELKEAGRLWLEAVDGYESGEGDLEKRMRDVIQTSKEAQATFRRVLGCER